jgi:hypothetical protein
LSRGKAPGEAEIKNPTFDKNHHIRYERWSNLRRLLKNNEGWDSLALQL